MERFPVGEKINWQIGEMVGAGAFGRVYLGLNNDTGQLMAVKQVRRRPQGGTTMHGCRCLPSQISMGRSRQRVGVKGGYGACLTWDMTLSVSLWSGRSLTRNTATTLSHEYSVQKDA